jgi:lactoylglutathione lyase
MGITDIDRWVASYNAFGFAEKGRIPIREEAINVFMGLADDSLEPRLELTCNIRRGEPYEVGLGFGHIAITAPELDETLSRQKEQGIEPKRPPYSIRGGGSPLCFVGDPDDYWIELIERG